MKYEFLTLNDALHDGVTEDEQLASLVNAGWEVFGAIGYTSFHDGDSWTDSRIMTLRREVQEFKADPVPQSALDEINRIGNLWDVTKNRPYTSDANLRRKSEEAADWRVLQGEFDALSMAHLGSLSAFDLDMSVENGDKLQETYEKLIAFLKRLHGIDPTPDFTMPPRRGPVVTESEAERAVRQRLVHLWDLKAEAYDDYMTANHDDYDACERYAKACEAYANVAHAYQSAPSAALPADVETAARAVIAARASSLFVHPEAAYAALLNACRAYLPTITQEEK